MLNIKLDIDGYHVTSEKTNNTFKCHTPKTLIDTLSAFGIRYEELRIALKELESNGHTQAFFGIDRTFIYSK